MATDVASLPVNGTFAPNHAQQNHAADSTSNNTPDAVQDISKEEVGWYFVERYYTTLSKKPDNLYLFYNKRSQSVFGVEDEKAPVCVGQNAINDRMKELDFEDCKIRVTNVDSQESGSDIVIQVIGEISNKSAPHRKFVQTFVLARQTNGYFVLNDIFRYIAEEDEVVDQEETQTSKPVANDIKESAPAVDQSEPKGLTSSNEPAEKERDAQLVDKKLEKVAEQAEKQPEAAPSTQVNGTSVPEGADVAHAEEAPVAAVSAVEKPVESASELEPEKPKDPEPSPAPTPAAPTTAPSAPKTPAAPPKPAAPKTWASLAASANRSAPPAATPSVATPAPQQLKPTSQTAAPSSTTSSTPVVPAQQPPAGEPADTDGQQSDGWQAVSSGHDRKQSRAQGQVSSEPPRFRAYIKNVFPNVDADALKAQLVKYGELSYFDVSRQKNCAFVDFTTNAGFQAAVAANPHKIGNDEVFVEERRERPFQYQPRGGIRGGRGGPDNRPGQGRGGFGKENARGGFQPRGRGNITPRGRGTSQAA